MSSPANATASSDPNAINTTEEQVERINIRAKGIGRPGDSPTSSVRSEKEAIWTENGQIRHGVAEVVGGAEDEADPNAHSGAAEASAEGPVTLVERFQNARKGYFAYIKTREFWMVLALGQLLSLCLTGTNTLSEVLANEHISIPAFQNLFNYVLLNLIYTSYTIYRYGFKKYGQMLWRDGWRYLILSFCDVEGNYFFVLAYRYTTILSAQLINFWAIVIVVLVSLILLKVRYKITQYAGILICVGGMGILIASDHITGVNGGVVPNQLKGDLFALLGATFYGSSNIFEEFLVSKRPLYEVLGQMGFWGMLISGAQTGIFDRDGFHQAVWKPVVGGHMVGYTLILCLFYHLAPLMFRMGSAAFFNISLLTTNFWGVLIGIRVFHLRVHYLYPIAFVLILCGLIVYFMTESFLGQANKPWLGPEQERGISGVGTAKRKAERMAAALPNTGVVARNDSQV